MPLIPPHIPMSRAALGETIKNLSLNKILSLNGNTLSHGYLTAAEPSTLLQLIPDDAQQTGDPRQVQVSGSKKAGRVWVVHVSTGLRVRQADAGP